jgi:hypothetical protein
MMDFIKKVFKIDLIFAVGVACVLCLVGNWRWAFGFFVSAIWMFANVFFLMNIFQTALARGSRRELAFLIVIKYPLLYLVAYFIMKARVVPLESLLAGTLFTLVVFGGMSAWLRRT